MNPSRIIKPLTLGINISLISACSAVSDSTVRHEKSSVKKPNIVIIEVDDLMYRFTGKLGRHFVDTPNIDKIAQTGVYFSNAVSQGVMCGPSRNSLITGLYPHNLGFYRNGQMWNLPENIWSLGGAMQRAGYKTAWIGKCHVHPPIPPGTPSISAENMKYMGFDYSLASWDRYMLWRRIKRGKSTEGFAYFDYLKKLGLFDRYVEDCKRKNPYTSLPENAYLDGYFTLMTEKWLAENKQSVKPLFLWLNYSLPHGPYDVPEKYYKIYEKRDIPPPMSDDFGGVQVPACLLKDNKAASIEKINKKRKAYAATCTCLDKLVGRVLESLKSNNMQKNTVIIFFSDHGIFMGNHGRIHKGTLFNEVTSPSLIIAYPENFKQGYIEDSPVELLDIVRTVLDIGKAEKRDKDIPFGNSLLKTLKKQSDKVADNSEKRYVFSEIEGARLCFDGRYRLISTDKGELLLYDIKDDPYELKNIADKKPDIVKEMVNETKLWYKKTGHPLPAGYLKESGHLKEFKRKNFNIKE